jgi:hypothetical protein
MPARRGYGAGPASRVAWYLKFRLSASTCAGTVISLGHSQHGSKLYVHSDRGRAPLKFLSVLWPFSGVRFGSAVALGGVSGAILLCRYAFTCDGKAWNKPWSRVLCARRVGAGYHNVFGTDVICGYRILGSSSRLALVSDCEIHAGVCRFDNGNLWLLAAPEEPARGMAALSLGTLVVVEFGVVGRYTGFSGGGLRFSVQHPNRVYGGGVACQRISGCVLASVRN